MQLFDLAQRILETVWRFHFHVPPAAYWATSLGGIGVIGINKPLVGFFLVGLGIQGILRWEWHRRQSRALVVTRFSTVVGSEGRARRVQELVMTRLQDSLPETYHSLFHAIPAVVGPADRSFAVRLLRRLGCMFLLHGRIDERPEGGFAVFARVAQSSEREVIHLDWHTRDRTPAHGTWSTLFDLLTPTHDVAVDEYPLEFANELQAVIRGIAGQIGNFVGDFPRAEELLRDAIAIAPASTSHQIDRLRCELARAIAQQHRLTEARDYLLDRARGDNPSPALLRTIFELMFIGHHAYGEDIDRDEAIGVLRRAAAVETDPLRDMTLYNLAQQLGGGTGAPNEEAEARDLLRQLMSTSRYYRRTWYLRRDLGGSAWYAALAAEATGDDEAATREFRDAARWYSAAIRRRPRFKLLFRDGPRFRVFSRYPRSPILYANAVEAAGRARMRVRAWWVEQRFQRLRDRFLRRAQRHLRRGKWEDAYAFADWAVVGRHDSSEAMAHLLKSFAAKQLQQDEVADTSWQIAFELEPLTLVARAELAQLPSLERGIPGDEPTEDEAVLAELVNLGVIEVE